MFPQSAIKSREHSLELRQLWECNIFASMTEEQKEGIESAIRTGQRGRYCKPCVLRENKDETNGKKERQKLAPLPLQMGKGQPHGCIKAENFLRCFKFNEFSNQRLAASNFR